MYRFLGDLVDATAHPSEERMLSCDVCRKRCLDRFPKQRLTGEFASRRMYFARRHRLPGQLEHQCHGLEHRAHLDGSGPGFTRIDQSPAEQLVVERAQAYKLNPG